MQKICRNCKYFDGNALKSWCIYWKSEINALVRTYGCTKWEEAEDDYWENVTGL